jgi:hypothetical protein
VGKNVLLARVIVQGMMTMIINKGTKMIKKILTAAALLTCSVFILGASDGCSDADVASHNISKAADQFEIMRRVVFYNGITDGYILKVEGLCSLGNFDSTGELSVTCKTGANKYVKHYLGLSDNVTYFAEQMEGVDVSLYHYRVTFKPQVILPDIDFRGSANELIENHGQ